MPPGKASALSSSPAHDYLPSPLTLCGLLAGILKESEATQTSEEAAANARLISKSPDLFALACGVVADSDEASVHDPRYRQACDLVQEITYCGDSQVYDRAVKHLESEATS